jgi:hypothetical protein
VFAMSGWLGQDGGGGGTVRQNHAPPSPLPPPCPSPPSPFIWALPASPLLPFFTLWKVYCVLIVQSNETGLTEGEFLDVIGTKVWRVFLFAIYSQSPILTDFSPLPPPPPSKSGLKLVCNVNIVFGNLKSENSQDYKIMPRNLNESVRSWIRLCGLPFLSLRKISLVFFNKFLNRGEGVPMFHIIPTFLLMSIFFLIYCIIIFNLLWGPYSNA